MDNATKKAGLGELKSKLGKALHHFVSGKDVFVALPTGCEKSFCYALLPALFDQLRSSVEASIVICASPLTALMMEQRAKFTVRGISADLLDASYMSLPCGFAPTCVIVLRFNYPRPATFQGYGSG